MPLDDALELCLLFLELEPARFDAAAATVGTRMVNNKVPIDTIQRMLDH